MISVVRPLITSRSPRADLRLRRRVDRGGRVVEDQDARVDREGARDRDPLPLAARERDAALADHRLVALRQPLDELVRLREPRDALDLGVAHLRAAERDVLAHGRREEERILRDDADLAAQRGERDVAHVDAVDEHAARVDVVEARHERGERRLARAGVADERDASCPASSVEVELLEHGPAGQVREGDVLEADLRRRRAAARPAPGWSATSSGSSSTWKMRSPEAVARCAWPTHIPSERSGMTSIAR